MKYAIGGWVCLMLLAGGAGLFNGCAEIHTQSMWVVLGVVMMVVSLVVSTALVTGLAISCAIVGKKES